MSATAIRTTNLAADPAVAQRTSGTVREEITRGTALVLANVAAASGVIIVLGWLLDDSAMKRALVGSVDIKFNTGFALILLGCSLSLAAWRRHSNLFARACAATAMLLGLATLVEYIVRAEVDLDELFVRDLVSTAAYPGRMAPHSAVKIALLGASFLAIESRRRWLRVIAHVALNCVLILALLTAVTLIFGGHTFYTLPPFTPIAPTTVFLLFALAAGMLLLHSDKGWMGVLFTPTVGGRVARQLILATILIPALLTWGRYEGTRAGLFDELFGVTMVATLMVVSLMTVLLVAAYRLHGEDLRRMEAERALRNTYEVLAAHVAGSSPASAGNDRDLEARVRSLAEQLARKNAELEAFTYSVSHDLRAPLRSIDGFSREVMERYSSTLDENGIHYLQRVRAASQKMGRLIDDLLRLSRIGRTEVRITQVDVTAMCERIASELREREPGRMVEVVIQEGIVVPADRELLRVVLVNLLDNGWKFTSRQEHPRVSVTARDGNDSVAVSVSDNGAGFDMQYGAKLFGPFQRLHTASEFEGTGIGLAIVQRIVARHGGGVSAQSSPGSGATFTFTLPKRETPS